MPPSSSSSSRRRKRRPCIERVVVLLLLALAWSWIAAAFVIVYHSMDTASSAAAATAQNNNNNNMQPQRQPPITQQQQDNVIVGETPLLIFTCRRAEYLRETLNDVFSFLPKDCRIGCPVIISQDGHDASVEQVVKEFQKKYSSIPIQHYQHDPESNLRKQPYKELAIHYKWAIHQVFFDHPHAQQVIILEEDLHLAPDFFGYFEKMTPLLNADSSLLAVSAFNDNGIQGKIKDPKRILRSDFFPGLGWMLTRRLWDNELSSKWPDGYWDDWLREPQQRQGRHILRPEVSRTFHFGTKGGASSNQFGSLLSSVALNTETVDWNTVDVNLLKDATRYEEEYLNMVKKAHISSSIQEALQQVSFKNVQLEYKNLQHFATLAKQLHLMEDEKAGVPRTAYKGIVETRPFGEHLLFLVPRGGTKVKKR